MAWLNLKGDMSLSRVGTIGGLCFKQCPKATPLFVF
jgi:hypothetical protein